MRRKILASLLLIISSSLLAQQNYDGNNSIDFSIVQFGFKITPAITWIDAVNNEITAEGAAMKFGVGLVASYPLTSALSLVSGINYHDFGGYVFDNKSLNYVDTASSYKINYKEIEVPLVLKLQTLPLNNTSYFLQGGFSFGFITNANEKFSLKAANSDPLYEDIDSYTNPSRISYQLGAGMEYSISRKSNIFALISYSKSLTNVANSDNYTKVIPPNTVARYDSQVQFFPGSMEFSIGVMF